MRKKIKLVLLLLKYNWKSLIGFELLYKLLGGAFVVPFIYRTSQWIMKMMGYHYLTLENLHKLAPDARCGFCEGCFTGKYPIDMD